jgi:hypothetical protein
LNSDDSGAERCIFPDFTPGRASEKGRIRKAHLRSREWPHQVLERIADFHPTEPFESIGAKVA